MGDHVEQGQLAKVEESFCRQRASQEEDCTVWCSVVELHESLESVLVAGRDDISFLFCENKSRQPRQEDREGIQLFNSETSSRISMVVEGESSWEN